MHANFIKDFNKALLRKAQQIINKEKQKRLQADFRDFLDFHATQH